jgi:hypothetical protein
MIANDILKTNINLDSVGKTSTAKSNRTTGNGSP